MPLEWWQHDHAPTRNELEREEAEEALRDSYEERFREFCEIESLDPEDAESAQAFEEWFSENNGEENRH
jgi:hypothetical protein